jgi:hypothetical protein
LNSTYGCTDSTAINYNPLATIDDSSCIYGCSTAISITNDTIPCGWSVLLHANHPNQNWDTNYTPLWSGGLISGYTYDTVTVTPTTSTTYNLMYSNWTNDTCSASITIHVEMPEVLASVISGLPCSGVDTLNALVTVLPTYYYIELWDGVGDGWNAGGSPAQYHSLEVHINGILYNNYTMLSGSGPDIYYIQVNDGDILETFPQNNGANYADCGYVIRDSQNIIVCLDGLPPVLGNPMVGCNTNLNNYPEVNVFIPNILTYSFSWQTLNGSITGLSNPNIYNPSVTVNFFTDYIVTAYDSAYSWCSVFDTITVFPNNTSVQLQQTISICDDDSLWIGSNYHTITGNYIDTLTATNGCDSIVYTNLTVKNNTASYDTLSVNVSIVWNGMTLTFSGDYSFTLINSVGCDSIVNLNLTINPSGILIIMNREKTLLKVTDVLGREIPYQERTPLFYIYDDGTVEKRITIE